MKSMNIGHIYTLLDSIAPFKMAADYDNCGILIGSPSDVINRVMLCLDITTEAIDQAVAERVNLIVCHHPPTFSPLRRIESDSLVYRLIREGIGVIAAHTNLDIANGGLNDLLSTKFQLKDIKGFAPEAELFTGRIGELPSPLTPVALANHIKSCLGCPSVQLVCAEKSKNKSNKVVAVCSGAGDFLAEQAYAAGAEAYITSQLKHSTALWAREKDFILIDAGHYETENFIYALLADRIHEAFPELMLIDFRGSPVRQII